MSADLLRHKIESNDWAPHLEYDEFLIWEGNPENRLGINGSEDRAFTIVGSVLSMIGIGFLVMAIINWYDPDLPFFNSRSHPVTLFVVLVCSF